MRRTYISKEFETKLTYGTYNMLEETNYFGSKMLEIEDTIYLASQNLIYYEKSNGEQLDLGAETSLSSTIYSSSVNKQKNHTLKLDETQSSFQKDNNTTWILEIDLKTLLSDFLFATLKRYRTFEGVRTFMTRSGDINSTVNEYIRNNVSNRYKFKRIDVYIQYKDLRNQNVLRYKNNWNPQVEVEQNKFTKLQTDLTYDYSKIKVIFNQEKTSKNFTFDYYYNILFEKI